MQFMKWAQKHLCNKAKWNLLMLYRLQWVVDGEWNMEWILSKKTRTSYTQIQTDGTNWIHVQIYIVVCCGVVKFIL